VSTGPHPPPGPRPATHPTPRPVPTGVDVEADPRSGDVVLMFHTATGIGVYFMNREAAMTFAQAVADVAGAPPPLIVVGGR
jgi:hypothetical protein